MISFNEAIDIVVEFSQLINEKFPNRVKAVYAIGSLGSDYYRPGQSDIDTAVITDLSRNDIGEISIGIKEIAATLQKKYDVPKGFGAIVFSYEQLFPPYIIEEELIQEILRLKTQSRLVYGTYDITSVPFPNWKVIKDDILYFQEWSDSQPPFKHSVTSFVNSTLIALKRYLLLKHHIIEFNKFKVIGLYQCNEPLLTNEKIFQFISDYLNNRPYEWNDKIRDEYVMWHNELYRVINDSVLYNE